MNNYTNRVKELEEEIKSVMRTIKYLHIKDIEEDLPDFSKKEHIILIELLEQKQALEELLKNGKIGETCMGDPINDFLYRKSPRGENELILSPDHYITTQEQRIQHAVSCAVAFTNNQTETYGNYGELDLKAIGGDLKSISKLILTICKELKEEND